MPVYIFQHPVTEEVKEVVQKMNEPHVFIDEDSTEWCRVFQSPNMAVDGDGMGADTSCEEFIRKTKDKNYNLGEMWDKSAELSEKRAKIGGKDYVKEKAKEAYSKKCKGKRHPNEG
jgi:predicted nucleic acid-binding Zn ribbon protein